MKRWLLWILVLVCLLTGCTGQPEDTKPNEGTDSEIQTKPTAPVRSLLWHGSALEQATAGAVKVFAPDEGRITCLGFMNEDPVLVTDCEGSTMLTRFDGKTGEVANQSRFNGSLDAVIMNEDRMACYDPEKNMFRIMDASFRELDSVKMQQQPDATPLISGDLTAAYYTVDNEILALDLQTGIPRLVCQLRSQDIFLSALLFDDAVLCGIVTEEEGSRAVFLNTQNGIILDSDETLISVQSCADRYLVCRLDGTTAEVLTGLKDGDISRFAPAGNGRSGLTLLGQGILEREYTASGTTLNLHSVENGKRIAQLKLGGLKSVTRVAEDPTGSFLWIVTRDPDTDQDILCRWEFGVSGGADEIVRIGTRFTADNPDADGIARCRQKAAEIGEKYGVQIHLGDEVKEPDTYTFTNEYQVDAFEKALEELDAAMAKFPEGFFKTAAKVTNDRVLHIGIIRDLQENVLNSQVRTDGVKYLLSGNAYIAICVSEDMTLNFYRMLSRAVDTYVYSYSIYYDFWADCNPEGFAYDESYDFYHAHENSPYLDGENRAFIDAFSMTYAYEDRATVMAYAIMDGNESYFQSEIMQAKLRQLCLGLREAFGYEEYEGTFIWEQYLKESLAYIPEE